MSSLGIPRNARAIAVGSKGRRGTINDPPMFATPWSQAALGALNPATSFSRTAFSHSTIESSKPGLSLFRTRNPVVATTALGTTPANSTKEPEMSIFFKRKPGGRESLNPMTSKGWVRKPPRRFSK